MKNIYIDDLQIHSNTSNLGYLITPKLDGFGFPEMRASRYNRAGEDGGVVSNQLYGGRRITMEGKIFASTYSAFALLRTQLVQYLDTEKDSNGVPQPKLLKFTTIGDLALQAEVFVLNFKMGWENPLSTEFLLDLFAPDYNFYNQTLDSSQLFRASGGGFILPVILPIITTAQVGGSTVITNDGNTKTYPIIYLNGPLDNPVIGNSTVGRTLGLNVTIASGEQVIIDMRKKTILKGAQSLISNKTEGSEWWWLEKGANTITLNTSSTSDTGDAQITYRDAYLGV